MTLYHVIDVTQIILILWKTWPQGLEVGARFFLYTHREKYSCQKILGRFENNLAQGVSKIVQVILIPWKTWPPWGVFSSIYRGRGGGGGGNLLRKNYRVDLKIVWHRCSLDDSTKFVQIMWLNENHACQVARTGFLIHTCMYIAKTLKKTLS